MPQEIEEILRQQKAVGRLTDQLTRWIQWVAGSLVLTFAFLELQNAPFDKITQAFDDASVMKLGLFLFFSGWAVGALDDTKIQKMAFALDPKEGKLGVEEVLGISVFITVFFALFSLHDDLLFFQLFLLVFISVNVWTYSVVIMKRSVIIANKSAEYYISERDNILYYKLHCAVEYLTGNWQRRRFATLIILALIQVMLAGYMKFFGIPDELGAIRVKDVPLNVILSYGPSVIFVIYVIISEGWMKIYRIKIFSDFNTIE